MTTEHNNAALAERLANRFLIWRLPRTVCADLCATNNAYKHPRSGTNLLNADEARQMVEHLLADPELTAALPATAPLDDAELQRQIRNIVACSLDEDCVGDCAKSPDGCGCAGVVAHAVANLIQRQRAVPVGWKLVPIEPTEAMKDAGWIDKEDVSPTDIYYEMLAAAPPAPAEAVSGCCTVRQYSDQMRCDRCGLTWDVNDPTAPRCAPPAEPDVVQNTGPFDHLPLPPSAHDLARPTEDDIAQAEYEAELELNFPANEKILVGKVYHPDVVQELVEALEEIERFPYVGMKASAEISRIARAALAAARARGGQHGQ